MEQTNRLTKALRWTGSLALIASGLVFLIQGLGAVSSFERFLSFGALTGVLGGLGIFFGARLKEGKSARTFLALAAAATPALFAQIGAMMYSGVESQYMPNFLDVAAPSMAIAGIAALGTSLVMTPILYLGFGAFFRAQAKQLMLFLLAGSLFLILPTRDNNMVAALILVQTIALLHFGRKLNADRAKAGEKESQIAMALPVIPIAIMVGRGLFYHPTNMFGAASFAWLGAFLYTMVPERAKNFATLCATVSWGFFATELCNWAGIAHGVIPMFVLYPPAIFVMLKANSFGGQKSKLVMTAAFFACAAPFMTLIEAWGFDGALALVSGGMVATVLGYDNRNQLVFHNGLAVFGAGLLYFIKLSFTYFANMPWLSLAILGVAVIMIAGWLEKNRKQFDQWKLAYHKRFE